MYTSTGTHLVASSSLPKTRGTGHAAQVEGIPEKYNEQCLAVSDAIGGDYTKAILVRIVVGVRALSAVHVVSY